MIAVQKIDYSKVPDEARTRFFMMIYDHHNGDVNAIADAIRINPKQVYTYHPSRIGTGRRFSIPSDRLLARIIEVCMKIDPKKTEAILEDQVVGIPSTIGAPSVEFVDVSKAMLSNEVRALELNAEYLGVSRVQLMENAGYAVAKEVTARFKPRDGNVVVYAGLGGNGGDGFVVARHLTGVGFKVDVVLAGNPEDIVDEAAKRNWEAIKLLRHSITTHIVYNSTVIPKLKSMVAIDALLGTGAKGELRPPILQLVRDINSAGKFRVSVDVPTGVDADTGEVRGEAVKANLTVTFHRSKPGLLKARRYVGKLVVAEIGIPPEASLYAGPGDVYLVRKTRPPEAHKGDFGRLLVIGGSETFSGAPALSALAALRTGVDITYVAAPRDTARIIASMSPNLLTVKLEGTHLNPRNVGAISEFLPKATGVILGPGSGLHPDTVEFVKQTIPVIERSGLPMLLDADALKIFAGFKRKLKVPLVLTPHAGEYGILTGEAPPKDLRERVNHVRKTAVELGATILLKGYVDVISDGTSVKMNFTGNPGMTVGGTGDTLCGIVGAFLAQGFSAFRAAVAGAFINGAAGDFVYKAKGYHMVPTDLLKWIPRVMDLCESGKGIAVLKRLYEEKNTDT